MIIQLTIKNMSCQHCVKQVTQALSNLDGVQEVAVDLAKQAAIVTGLVEHDLASYQAALADMPYEVVALSLLAHE